MNTVRVDGALCNTPVGSPGVCISIKSCEPLLDVLRAQSGNPEVRNYLRKSACGFLGTVPLVCCPQAQRGLTTEQPAPVVQTTPPPPAPVVDGTQELLRPPNCGYSNISFPRVVGGIPAKLGKCFGFLKTIRSLYSSDELATRAKLESRVLLLLNFASSLLPSTTTVLLPSSFARQKEIPRYRLLINLHKKIDTFYIKTH